jgi:hypothetical protein
VKVSDAFGSAQEFQAANQLFKASVYDPCAHFHCPNWTHLQFSLDRLESRSSVFFEQAPEQITKFWMLRAVLGMGANKVFKK